MNARTRQRYQPRDMAPVKNKERPEQAGYVFYLVEWEIQGGESSWVLIGFHRENDLQAGRTYDITSKDSSQEYVLCPCAEC